MPPDGVTISRTLPAPLPAEDVATLAYFNPTRSAWTAVPTSLSSDRRTIVTTAHHLTVWDDIVYGAASVISKRADKPDCEERLPTWLKDAIFLDDKNAPVRWCAGRDHDHPELLVVKLVVNRPYGVAVVLATPPASAKNSLFASGPEDLLTNVLARTFDLPTAAENTFGGKLLLPGGSTAEFRFTEDQVRKIGTKPLVTVDAEVTYALAGMTYGALSDLLGSGQGVIAGVTTMISVTQCAYDLITSAAKHDWSELTGAALRCLGSHADDVARDSATALTKLYPTHSPRELGTWAGKAAGKLWIIWSLGKVFQLGEWGADARLAAAAWTMTVYPTTRVKLPQPTLGKVWAPSQEGYGTQRPSTIFNGGDPTGLVTDVHWRSWGSPQAIGDGTSIDDSHSPSVAEAPQAKATVVAFDLGPCEGKLMYRAITWYFPERGGSFNPHVHINICTGEYVG